MLPPPDVHVWPPTYVRNCGKFQGTTVPALRLRIAGANSQSRAHMQGSNFKAQAGYTAHAKNHSPP